MSGTALIGFGLAADAAAQAASETAASMTIARAGSQASTRGPAANFTGAVRVDPLYQAPARSSAALVIFEPGARSAWHSHPLGQTLIVTSGVGRVQIASQESLDGKVVEWMEQVSEAQYRRQP